MCVIAILNPNSDIPWVELDQMAESNPDGYGLFGYVNGSPVISKSSVSIGWTDTLDWIHRRTRSRIVIHFRIRTAGEISVCNAHPFRIAKNEYLFHNGTIKTLQYDQACHRSDTAQFAEYLGSIRSESPAVYADEEIKDTLQLEANLGSKFVHVIGKKLRMYGQWHDMPFGKVSNTFWERSTFNFGLKGDQPCGF